MKTESVEEFLKRGGEIKKPQYSEAYAKRFKWSWITKKKAIHSQKSILANKTPSITTHQLQDEN